MGSATCSRLGTFLESSLLKHFPGNSPKKRSALCWRESFVACRKHTRLDLLESALHQKRGPALRDVSPSVSKDSKDRRRLVSRLLAGLPFQSTNTSIRSDDIRICFLPSVPTLPPIANLSLTRSPQLATALAPFTPADVKLAVLSTRP